MRYDRNIELYGKVVKSRHAHSVLVDCSPLQACNIMLSAMPARIGTLAEKSLHAQLKRLYAQPGDLLEHALDGYVIDIARPNRAERNGADGGGAAGPDLRCIEIQTRGLAKMKPKLLALLPQRPVQVILPIAAETTIVRLDGSGAPISRRRSPKHGCVLHVFAELVSLPTLLADPNFSLEVLLTREEQFWRDDGRGSWRRRRWSIHDRRLLAVVGSTPLICPGDCAALLPSDLPDGFTARDLAAVTGQPLALAQKMAYCLRQMGVLAATGKQGNALVYARADTSQG